MRAGNWIVNQFPIAMVDSAADSTPIVLTLTAAQGDYQLTILLTFQRPDIQNDYMLNSGSISGMNVRICKQVERVMRVAGIKA